MKKLIGLLAIILLATGCATSTKKDIAAEAAEVAPFASRESVMERAMDVINRSPNLTAQQKEQFVNLQGETYEAVQGINEEMKKLKIVLFKNITAKNYDEHKVTTITRQMKKLQSKKFDVMLGSLTKAKQIVGHEVEFPYDDFWFERTQDLAK